MTGEELVKLTRLIQDYFGTLNSFGKNLDSVTKIMILKLKKYPFKAIEWAFNEWSDHNADFPTPADIIGLIE